MSAARSTYPKPRTPRTSTPATRARYLEKASAKPARHDPSRLAERLIREYAPLVHAIAGAFLRRLPRNVLREDLVAAGMSGLWDAIRKHPDGPSPTFEWYVRVRVRGAILDELRAQDWLPRRARALAELTTHTAAPMPAPSVVRLDDVSEWEQNRCLSDASNSETAYARRVAEETLEHAVERLPERERHIVRAHYYRGARFKDLGSELGVSEPRVSQLHSRALGRLRALVDPAA